jgi:CheY-like chemotaxis protein/glycine cleavage system H lipoate-binding protein
MSEPTRILVVDDEPPVCKSVSSALVTEDYAVDTALSAEEALRKAESSEYDVVITDLMMPGLSGMDLLKMASERMPGAKVIMITGYPSVKSAVEAMRLGAFDYIPKPFTPKELRGLVSRALESKRYHAEEDITPPGGIYCIPENSWAAVEESGSVRVGVHHVFLKTIPQIASLELPEEGEMKYQGEACAKLTDSRGFVHKVWAPISGRVVTVNDLVAGDYSSLLRDPYGQGWLFMMAATDLEDDLKNLVVTS